jgi:uncharacterized membrane protein YvlD (DUF360 family)
MADILVNLFLLVTQAWTFISDNFVPANAASMSIIHMAVWAPVVYAAVAFIFGLVTRRGARR